MTKRATGISLIILLGFIAAVSYHYYRGCYLQMPYPYNTFLFRFDDHFMDLLNIIRGCKDRDPYDASRLLYMCGYMPFGYLIGVILRVFKNPMFVFTSSIILLLLVLFMLNYCFFTRRPNSWMQSLPVVIFTFFTYPVLFVIDRGNFDMYIFMLIILFLWSFYTGHMKLAMLSLAMTIAIKIYTIAYIILFIQERQYKKALYVLGITGLLTVFSLALFKGGLVANYFKWIISMHETTRIVIYHGLSVRFSTCFFTFFSFIGLMFGKHLYASRSFVNIYSALSFLTFIILSVYLCRNQVARWRTISLVTLAMILLAPTTCDYRLIFLFLPLWGFCVFASPSKLDRYFILLLGLSFIPKNYYILTDNLNIGMLINPILLLMLGVVLFLGHKPSPGQLASTDETDTSRLPVETTS